MKNEIDSKSLLKRYGIQTTEPMLATSAAEAADKARSFGATVAMKVVSTDVVHKFEVKGVRLGVAPEHAAQAYEEIMERVSAYQPQAKLEGVLVEEMVPAGLEVFIGAKLDPEFGPVVLVGYGGSGIEQGRPPAVALVPLTPEMAERLIDEAFGALIEERAGHKAVQVLRDYLLAVGGQEGLLKKEGIGELDINPIILSHNQAVAVDAVVGELPAGTDSETLWDSACDQAVTRRRTRLCGLGALFDPASVAVVGASTAKNKLGYRIIRLMLDFGFRGPIYPIHPAAGEICGLKAYKSIEEVPGPVERAYVAVAASQVPEVLAECARKGVKVAQVLTAGFSEYSNQGDETGHPLEGQIADILADSNLRVVGPNCIGTFSASSSIAIGPPRYSPTEPGGITFISQSGTFACDVVRRAKVQGLPVGRALSAGNCTDLDLVDYLLFCEDDPNTTLSAFYSESLRDPGLFFRIAAKARKPIVMLKGGVTEQGLTAASSHTAALATNRLLWDAAIRQAGVLQVDGVEELIDVLLIYSAHGYLAGNRLAIFGSGGGVSVTSADVATRAGMKVPPFDRETAAALRRFYVPGTSVANPIDIPVWGLRDGKNYILEEIIDLLKKDPNVDSIIVYVEAGSIMDFADDEQNGFSQLEDICASVARARPEGAKISLALRSSGDRLQDDLVRVQRLALLPKGIAVFSSTARAVRAHANLLTMSRRAPGATEWARGAQEPTYHDYQIQHGAQL